MTIIPDILDKLKKNKDIYNKNYIKKNKRK